MDLTIRFSGGHRGSFGDHDFEGILMGSLDRFAQRLKQVCLYITDTNGPRGGVDKQCRCVLHLRRMPPVVIRDQDEDTYALVSRVANRAAFALSQTRERRTRRGKRLRSRGLKDASFSGDSQS